MFLYWRLYSARELNKKCSEVVTLISNSEYFLSYSITSPASNLQIIFMTLSPSIWLEGHWGSNKIYVQNDYKSWGRERGVQFVCGLTALKINFFRGFKLGGGLGELDARGNGFHILWATSAKVILAQKWNHSKVGGVMLDSIRVRLSRGRICANFG